MRKTQLSLFLIANKIIKSIIIIGLQVNNLPIYSCNCKLFIFIRTNCQRFNYLASTTVDYHKLIASVANPHHRHSTKTQFNEY